MVKQAFKTGSKVRCVKESYFNSTLGKIYTVANPPSYADQTWANQWFEVAADDRGASNCFPPDNFELVAPAKRKVKNPTKKSGLKARAAKKAKARK